MINRSFFDIWEKNFQERVSQLIFNETIIYQKKINFVLTREQFHVNSISLRQHYYFGYARIFPEDLVPFSENYKPNYVVVSRNAQLLPHKILIPFGSFLHINENGIVSHSLYKDCVCEIQHLRPFRSYFSIKTFCEDATSLLNVPYVWGGRTVHNALRNDYIGVDCSGFVNLLFRAQGILSPRDAKQQFLKCCPYKNFEDLPIGGLVFLIDKNTKIDHVMIKLDDHKIIDASMAEKKVRILTKNHTFIVKNNVIDIKGTAYTACFGTMKNELSSELVYNC